MPQPLSHPDLRRRNLSLLFDTLLRHEEATRKQIQEESGLSKATVSRLTDELLQAGALLPRATAPVAPSTRGRRAETLSAAPTLGVVAGVSLGTHMTSVFVTDLTGRELAWRHVPTPAWDRTEEAVDWVCGFVSRATADLPGPLGRVIVAMPGHAVDGAVVTRPPRVLAALAGETFVRALGERLACPIRIELDAAMVLVGLEQLGFIDATVAPVLLNASSVLTMSLRRRDGSIARGLTPSFGNFDLLPVETELGTRRIGDLLGAGGLLDLAASIDAPVTELGDLWAASGAEIARLTEAFAAALTQLIRIISVMTDPSLIIVTGSLSPLVRRVLPGVEATLQRELPARPEIRVIGHAENGFPAAVGSAREARSRAVAALLERISRDGLSALTASPEA